MFPVDTNHQIGDVDQLALLVEVTLKMICFDDTLSPLLIVLGSQLIVVELP
jgi:hypothetical protein